MKKIFTSLLLLVAAVVTANAEMKTVWEGSHEIGKWNWDTRLELTADAFSTLADGDKMVVTMSPNVEAAGAETWYQYEIYANDYVEGREPQRTLIASSDIAEAGDVTINLTNEQVSLLKEYGLIIHGHFVTITKIAVGTDGGGETPDPKPDPEDGTVVDVWTGEPVVTGEWGSLDLSYDKRGTLAQAKIGDEITVVLTDVNADAFISIGNPADGWTAFGEASEASLDAGTTEFTYTIPDVVTLEAIQFYGIAISGKNLTVSKVTLTTYPDSYDAVEITIGDGGIATYSNSSKSLDFTNAGIKAYYATAVETGKVTLSPATNVPNYTGIIVKGEPGTYEVRTGEGVEVATNYLKAVGDWATNIVVGDLPQGTYDYIFIESGEPTFSLVTVDTEVPARKAFLETTTDITPADGVIELVFTDDIESGIEAVTTEKQGDDAWYNLQGMRVERPAHGIYIHNGKKVLVK